MKLTKQGVRDLSSLGPQNTGFKPCMHPRGFVMVSENPNPKKGHPYTLLQCPTCKAKTKEPLEDV